MFCKTLCNPEPESAYRPDPATSGLWGKNEVSVSLTGTRGKVRIHCRVGSCLDQPNNPTQLHDFTPEQARELAQHLNLAAGLVEQGVTE